MTDKTSYEHGARHPVEKSGRDASDDFSQKAAENKKPPLGIGIASEVTPGQERAAKTDAAQAPTKVDMDDRIDGKLGTYNPPEPFPSEHPPRDTADSPSSNPDTPVSPKARN